MEVGTKTVCCNKLVAARTDQHLNRDATPNQGDIAICSACGALNQLQENGTWKTLTPEEEFQLMMSDEESWQGIINGRKLIQLVNKARDLTKS